jgi:DoxX
MDTRLNAPWQALRLGIGLTATLAGLDKFFNLLADWSAYVSPLATQLLPFSTTTLMWTVGVVEFAVGATILLGATRLGAYVASVWLLGVAVNLVLAGYLDVAVRDVVMSIAAFTLARLAEVREHAVGSGFAREQAGSGLAAGSA